jgi:UDP-2,3-diacylglucosamine pyrophosphatase LpxH
VKNEQKRTPEVVVLSDIHLGTYGCRSRELLNYLKSIEPKILILNGDIFDMWQFKKRFFPRSHMKIIKYFFSYLSKGTTIYYITGNHDELLRKFEGLQIGNLQIVNKLILDLDGRKAWIFHGDVFDFTMKYGIWAAKMGGKGYNFLIFINNIINRISERLGKGRVSFSKKVKNSVKKAVSYMNDFEQTVASIAIERRYDYVVCGHIHQPAKKQIVDKDNKGVLYLNSGDWIENLTSLEYSHGTWSVYEYEKENKIVKMNSMVPESDEDKQMLILDVNRKELYLQLIHEFNNK